MKFASLRQMKNKTSEDFEDYLLEHSPAFLKALEQARTEYLKTGGMSLDDYVRVLKKFP